MVRRAQNKGIVDDDEINADIADTVLRYAGEHYLSLKEKLRLKAYIYAAIRGLDVKSSTFREYGYTGRDQ